MIIRNDMSLKTVFVILIFCVFLFSAYLLTQLNLKEVTLDILFFSIEVKLGVLILSSFLVGTVTTLVLEVIFIFQKKKNKD